MRRKLFYILPIGRFEVVAFITGFVVLTFELTAARLVAPYMGATIYTWTSIIGVILAALAVGYYLGGALADYRKRLDDIILLLSLAAFAILMTYLMKDSVLALISTWGVALQLQSLLVSLLLFALPTVLLGAVSPYLARLSITEVATSGHKLSRIEAAGTIGSLIGTFMTGYILFGLVGSRSILIFLTVITLLASLLLNYKSHLYWRLAILAATLLLSFFPSKPPISGYITEMDTAYNHVVVRTLDYGGSQARILQTDNNALQSGIYEKNPDVLVFDYIQAFAYAAELQPNAQRQLIIGGGAFTFPEHLAKRRPAAKIDTVEIDKQLIDISRTYFDFDQPSNLNIVVADGRQFLNNNGVQYDTIFLDAFNSIIPPFQLLTQEAAAKMQTSLKPDGLVIGNIISAAETNEVQLINYVFNTFKSKFKHVAVYQVNPTNLPSQPQNLLIVASDTSISETAKKVTISPSLGYLLRNKLSLSYNPRLVLTDNYAPVELLTLR